MGPFLLENFCRSHAAKKQDEFGGFDSVTGRPPALPCAVLNGMRCAVRGAPWPQRHGHLMPIMGQAARRCKRGARARCAAVARPAVGVACHGNHREFPVQSCAALELRERAFLEAKTQHAYVERIHTKKG